jgi:hypothetical protein
VVRQVFPLLPLLRSLKLVWTSLRLPPYKFALRFASAYRLSDRTALISFGHIQNEIVRCALDPFPSFTDPRLWLIRDCAWCSCAVILQFQYHHCREHFSQRRCSLCRVTKGGKQPQCLSRTANFIPQPLILFCRYPESESGCRVPMRHQLKIVLLLRFQPKRNRSSIKHFDTYCKSWPS